MKKTYLTAIASLLPNAIIIFIVCSTFNVMAQSNEIKTDSILAKPKSKKQIYIDNYIANFAYKNSDMYEVIKQTQLWDTTGAVPVISLSTLSVNRKPMVAKDNKLEIEHK